MERKNKTLIARPIRSVSEPFATRFGILWLLLILSIVPLTGWGLEDALDYQEQARKKYIDRFSKFTQDKNVMGKAATPDKKQIRAGNKIRFNRDDGSPFQSDLTYHDYSNDRAEQISKPTPNDPNAKETRILRAFISNHGGISAEGGSSLLERTVYQAHEKYLKEDQANASKGTPPPPDKPGIEFSSVFKIITQEVKKNPGAASGTGTSPPGKNPPNDTTKVERWTMRDEVKKEVEKVGSDSTDSLIREARDTEAKDDPESMPNLSFLYESANRALQAWWNSTLSNLGQARSSRIKGTLPDGVELDEDVINGPEWAARKRQELQQGKPGGGKLSQGEEKAIDDMSKKAEEMAKVPYSTVNPDYITEPANGPNPPTEVLKSAGVEKEDSRERDLRLQMEVLAKSGVRLNSLSSNWKFTDKDEKAPVVINFDEDAKALNPTDLRVDEQLELYNKQLEQATKSYQDVQAKLPGVDINPDRHVKYRIQPGTKSAMDITKIPDSEYEALGLQNPPNALPLPKNYSELLKQN